MTLTMAIRKFFGQKEGQTLKEFGAEIAALTNKDRQELSVMLATEIGEEITFEMV